MRNVLLIGGTGIISGCITQKLCADPDSNVYLLKRTDDLTGLPDNITLLQGDMRTDSPDMAASITRQLDETGILFDCVASFVVYTPEEARRNYEIFRGRTRQFIYISTNCVLDHTITCRINEDSATGNRLSAYGISKRLTEEYFRSVDSPEFPVTIVRPSHTYSGNRLPLAIKGNSSWSVISRMLRGKEIIVHSDGQTVWPTTHSLDFAEWFCPLVANPMALHETYQIINDKVQTWDEIYRTVAEELGVPYKPVYISAYLLSASTVYNMHDELLGDKYSSNVFDTTKIKSMNPGFNPRIDLRTGVRMYLDFMEAHPDQKVEDEKFDSWCDHIIEKYHKLEAVFMEDI